MSHWPAGGRRPPATENASFPAPFPPGGTSNRGAAAPLIGRFKGKGSLGKGGRFPLSGGNVERSETKGVGTIRNPPFPKRLFGDFLSAQKVTRPQAKHPLTVQNLIRRPGEADSPCQGEMPRRGRGGRDHRALREEERTDGKHTRGRPHGAAPTKDRILPHGRTLWGQPFRPANKFLAKREAAPWAASAFFFSFPGWFPPPA